MYPFKRQFSLQGAFHGKYVSSVFSNCACEATDKTDFWSGGDNWWYEVQRVEISSATTMTRRKTIKYRQTKRITLEGMTVGDCGRTGRENGDLECSNTRVCRGTYDAVNLEKGEKSRSVRRYADVTREDVQNPLGGNRLIIP